MELLALRGGSVELGAQIACAHCIIEQTSAVRNFSTNRLFSKNLQNCYLDGDFTIYKNIFLLDTQLSLRQTGNCRKPALELIDARTLVFALRLND